MPEPEPPDVRPEALVYYASLTAEEALTYARERVDEWSYDEDPHGYCHERPTLMLLLRVAELGPGGNVCPACGRYFIGTHTCGGTRSPLPDPADTSASGASGPDR